MGVSTTTFTGSKPNRGGAAGSKRLVPLLLGVIRGKGDYDTLFRVTRFTGVQLMNFVEANIKGVVVVEHLIMKDARGLFVKPWVADELVAFFGCNAETYFSQSELGVFRGLHYQQGEKGQKKYVTCLSGAIEDVAVDLRPGSATYGRVFRKRLEAMSGIGVIIPSSFAHGIFAHKRSIIVNFCDKSYSPGDELGVNWASIPDIHDLPVKIVSDKDKHLPSLKEVLR
jgi:dTDP-4-dehydrorhamnose 3,5-epimerase